MADIINLLSKKVEYETTQTGQAFCLFCSHEWVAVAPAGVTMLECPDCGGMKGIFKYPCNRDEPNWVCGCGNDLFKVTKDGYYCVNCGIYQEGF